MPHLFIMAIAGAATIATLLGGALALRLRDQLHLILGFSAGAVIAVAFFDLLPESITLGAGTFSVSAMLTFTAVGFFFYTVLDRFIAHHSHEDSRVRGAVGAGSLSGHSMLDGFAIGLAFQASAGVGAIVTAAVLAHDFSDGINTVNLVLRNGGSREDAFRWLLADAIAPLLGAFATLFIHLPESMLAAILALYAGFFLYIGASDLLPESQHEHPKLFTTFLTLLGAVTLYVVIRLAA